MTAPRGFSGRPVGKAMAAAASAALSVAEMEREMTRMTDQNRLMFESVMSGDDELTAALKSNHTEWYTGITKLLTNKDGSRVMSGKVTLANKDDLAPEDYHRLVRICSSQVRIYAGTSDYRQYTRPIREYIQRFAPMALGTVMDVMQNGSKDETRLKAAKDLLDRAGEKEPERQADIQVPVQVNIMLTDQNGHAVKYGSDNGAG